MHRMQLTLLLERRESRWREAAPAILGADYRELYQPSRLIRSLWVNLPHRGDMVRFLAQAGLSRDAWTWEQTLIFFALGLAPKSWSSLLALGTGRGNKTRRREGGIACPPPTPHHSLCTSPLPQASHTLAPCHRNTLRVPGNSKVLTCHSAHSAEHPQIALAPPPLVSG